MGTMLRRVKRVQELAGGLVKDEVSTTDEPGLTQLTPKIRVESMCVHRA